MHLRGIGQGGLGQVQAWSDLDHQGLRASWVRGSECDDVRFGEMAYERLAARFQGADDSKAY